MPRILCITPDHDRADALAELHVCIQNMVSMPPAWVVACDSDMPVPAEANVVRRRGNRYLYRGRYLCKIINPDNSFLSNLYAGLCIAGELDNVAILESDEFYNVHYLSNLYNQLYSKELVGVRGCHNYHFKARRYEKLGNMSSSTLAGSAWQAKVTPWVKELCKRNNPHVDGMLWNEFGGTRELYDNVVPYAPRMKDLGTALNVSFKAMDGKKGMGTWHEATRYGSDDSSWSVLQELIGKGNMERYRRLWQKTFKGK